MTKKARRRRRKDEPPPLLRHPDGRGYSYDDRKPIYFGPFEAPETKRRHARFQQEWLKKHQTQAEPAFVAKAGGTVNALAAAYIGHCKTYYRRTDGSNTDEFRHNRDLWLRFSAEYGEYLADHFSREDLVEFRRRLIAEGKARKTVNKYVGRIKRGFIWGEGEGVVSEATVASLERLRDLPKGRSEARETEPVTPVKLRDIVAAIRQLPTSRRAVVRAMVRVQYYAGCRPRELCRMTVGEISTAGIATIKGQAVRVPGVWIFQPAQHKNLSRGVDLAYVLGPRARDAIAPYLEGKSPTDRVWPISQWWYSRLVNIACHAAAELGPCEIWSPGQLRHNYVSRVGNLLGIAAASEAIGHTNLHTTVGYFQKNLSRTAKNLEEIG